jgi:diguanylate cyclase (GGDEF)-like protein
VRAAIAAPVHDNGEIVGSIVVATRDGGQRYDHTHETLLQALAEHVTLAMTDAKTLEAMYLAFHDSLTGLASRALFLDRLQHGLSGAQRAKTTLGLLFIDLDRFKMVNDTLGHGAGDELLVQVADRVRGCLRISDTAARFGGDEFAVLLQDTTETGAQRVADRVIDAVRAPYAIGGREVFVNASIGIALSAPGLNDANELLRSADVAMYEAKRNGKGRHELFEPGMHAELMSRLELEADLRRAIDGNEFVLHYQPIVALETGRITAVEALVRWQHPRRGIVMPMDFIPLAEETGLIVPLGRWVLEEACRQAAEWQNGRATDVPLSISVNLSALQLEQRDVAASVAEALTAVALDPSCLILEITETLLMQDRKDTLAKMAELRSLGVRLAIDDFGTGYSSLSYLRQFPINILKIDKSFVDGIGAGPEESAFARAIVRLGQTLHLEMVAEGIEDLAQVDELRRAHCQSGQGYHFARPMPAAELTEILSGTPDDREQRLLPALPAPPATSVPLLASTAGATA